MLRDITIGQYYPVESAIHRMDPRFKIVSMFLYMVALFVIDKLPAYILVILFLTTMIFLSKVPLSYIIRGLKPIMMIILFTVIINLFFTDGTPLFSYGFIEITYKGVETALFMGLRLVFLIMGTSLLTLCTTPIELTDAIEHLLMPFKRIGLPAHELAMMMTISLRFIPTLLEETDKIMKAQMARGANLDSGNLYQRAKNLLPILVPLFVGAFRRADELAMAMESRCYRGGENRTRLKQLRFTRVDLYGTLAMIVFCSTILVSKWI